MSIYLPAELETRLTEEATKRGLTPSDYLRLLLERLLTPTPAETEEAARLASIDEAMGAFAYVPTSSEEFSHRKQEEIDLEEAQSHFAHNPLGPKLKALRAQIVATGESLLSWAEIECDVAERRG